jgi:pimeloyl-ACP methyl ester carboxylesterase
MGALAGAGALAALPGPAAAQSGRPVPTSFVLIHGATAGGWTWRAVRDLLTAAGHRVFTPSLTGLGERSHLTWSRIDLDVHVQDVVNVFRFERIDDAVLVGHSYGGMVVTGAVDRLAPAAVRRIIYLDAIVPRDGDAALDCFAPEIAELFRQLGADGWYHPGPTADPLDQPHPFATLTQPLRFWNPGRRAPPRAYIRCIDPTDALDPKDQAAVAFSRLESQALELSYQRAVAGGFQLDAIATRHDAMRTRPAELAEKLLRLAG